MSRQIIRQKLQELVSQVSGEYLTGGKISYNDNGICYAASMWFIHSVQTVGKAHTIQELAIMDKASLSPLHLQLNKKSRKILKTINKNLKQTKQVMEPEVEAAWGYTKAYFSKPKDKDLTPDPNKIAMEAIQKTLQLSSVLLFISGSEDDDNEDKGHVMCLTHYQNEILGYDPNLGVFSVSMSRCQQLISIITAILDFYKTEKAFTLFAIKTM